MFRYRLGRIAKCLRLPYLRSKKKFATGTSSRFGTSEVRNYGIKKAEKNHVNAHADDPFDPEDIAEMSALFSGIIKDADEGYVMEFIISKANAKEISETWAAAKLGDKYALAMCINEFGKIVEELERALKRED